MPARFRMTVCRKSGSMCFGCAVRRCGWVTSALRHLRSFRMTSSLAMIFSCSCDKDNVGEVQNNRIHYDSSTRQGSEFAEKNCENAPSMTLSFPASASPGEGNASFCRGNAFARRGNASFCRANASACSPEMLARQRRSTATTATPMSAESRPRRHRSLTQPCPAAARFSEATPPAVIRRATGTAKKVTRTRTRTRTTADEWPKMKRRLKKTGRGRWREASMRRSHARVGTRTACDAMRSSERQGSGRRRHSVTPQKLGNMARARPCENEIQQQRQMQN